MKLIICLICLYALIIAIGAPPVNEKVQEPPRKSDVADDQAADDVLNNLEYGRYLKEVVDILESDPEFKKKIENASLDDIKSGNIAEHLSLVQHNIRTQLDEAKQREMARLKDLVSQKVRGLSDKQRFALSRADPSGRQMREFLPQHVDAKNTDAFGRLDLERLIQHASKDLDAIDRRREESFKEYEMQKEFERRGKISKFNAEERAKFEKIHQEALEKRKRHGKVNHPGSVKQMEEVWEDVDKLEVDQFTPKSFFKLHDINSDGFLDVAELEAIMLKEAAKIHDGAPEADPVEKQEEMDRMRQHVMKEFDKNNDRMLSLEEFEFGINGSDAKNDQGWKSIEDSTAYSNQEFEQFSKNRFPQSTPIPRHQTPSPAGVQQPQVAPVQGVKPPQFQQQPNLNPEIPPVPKK